MLLLTPEEKRKRFVSNAVTLWLKSDPQWFDEIKQKIDQGLEKNPGKREQVVLKWILSAEQAGSKETKEEILKQYNDQRTTSGEDQDKVRIDE
jgi:hypothetical protein